MARKETVAQQKARYARTLADYDAANNDFRKAKKNLESLKELVEAIPDGVYGEWSRQSGTPREIMDQAAVRADYVERGVAVPMKMTERPIIVRPAAGK